jgi:hypothetical protein
LDEATHVLLTPEIIDPVTVRLDAGHYEFTAQMSPAR